ncbi:MAG: type IV toxin-antitoxin system AbiEi family antitoxin domain-containing protein [Polyangiaceae bacterium]
MKATDAYARLRALGLPVVSTADVAAALGETVNAAQKTLSRIAAASLIVPLRRGLWAMSPRLDPLLVAEHLTAPLLSYVSLQTALHEHGMIEQIPALIYVVSLDRSREIATSAGTFSIHRVTPEIFGGFDITATGVRLARPEKALFDVFYLSATRDRRFASLPELTLPRGFDRARLRAWSARVTSPTLRKIVEQKIAGLPRAMGRRYESSA